MAFNIQSFVRLSSAGSNAIITLEDGTFEGGPCFYSYVSATDDLSTITAANYFGSQAPVLNVSDLIYVVGIDGNEFATVATVNEDTQSVTVMLATPATGDVSGPASSVNGDVVIFSGTSGKDIAGSGYAGAKLPYAILQDGAVIYAADAGATDDYAITLAPVPAAYAVGMVINFKANTANTGAATLNVNGLGAKAIVKAHDLPLVTGDIEAGQIVTVVYDGTSFQMQSQTAVAVVTPFTWNDQTTTPVAAVANNGYIADAGATPVVVNLPATAAIGDQFRVQGKGTGFWQLVANTGQTIKLGAQTTTSGGSLTATNQYDSVHILCITANTTYAVLGVVGNLTFA